MMISIKMKNFHNFIRQKMVISSGMGFNPFLMILIKQFFSQNNK